MEGELDPSRDVKDDANIGVGSLDSYLIKCSD
jgi:hypothetical protein